MQERSQSPLSIALKDNNGIILSYILGYSVNHISNLTHQDIIHQNIASLDTSTVYLDQLYLKKGSPLFLAMRLFDKWDYIAQGEETTQVYGATPHTPWRNINSERIAINRGFSRTGFVEQEKTKLALMNKPYL